MLSSWTHGRPHPTTVQQELEPLSPNTTERRRSTIGEGEDSNYHLSMKLTADSNDIHSSVHAEDNQFFWHIDIWDWFIWHTSVLQYLAYSNPFFWKTTTTKTKQALSSLYTVGCKSLTPQWKSSDDATLKFVWIFKRFYFSLKLSRIFVMNIIVICNAYCCIKLETNAQ